MANYGLRIRARQLRSQGFSVKSISAQLGIAKSTASIWVRDVILTVEQLQALKLAEIKGAELGRLRGSLSQKNKRLSTISKYIYDGKKSIKTITMQELLLVGLALYWSEGSKKNGRLEFCNSDPKMIQFLLLWLEKCFDIPLTQLNCRVGINELHRNRDQVVKEYWSQVTQIPLTQFINSSFKKVKNKKVYDNLESHYGTLAVRVTKAGDLYYKILGLIEGLSFARVA